MLLIEVTKTQYKFIILGRSPQGQHEVGRSGVINKSDIGKDPDLLREIQRAFGPDTVVVLSRDQVMLSHCELPSRDPGELKEMVSLQAGRLTPFSREEVVVDLIACREFRPHQMQVLAAIVSLKLVNEILNAPVFDKKKVDRVVLSSECFGSCVPVNGVQGLIRIERGYNEFMIFNNGKLVFSKFIPIDLFSEIDLRQEFIKECQEVFLMNEREHFAEPLKNVYISGGLLGQVLLSELFEMCKGAFLGVNVFLWTLEYVPAALAKTLVVHKDMHLIDGVNFGALIGLALDHQRPVMNLVPDSVKQNAVSLLGRKKAMPALFLMVLIVLVVISDPYIRVKLKERQLDQLDQQLQQIRSLSGGLESKLEKINFISMLKRSRGGAPEIFREAFRSVHDKIYLTAISFETAGGVSFRGTSVSIADAFLFLEVIKKRNMFEQVQMKYINKRKVKDEEYADFEITANFRGK